MILGNITISILIFVAIKIKIIRKNYNHCLTYNTKNNCKNLMFYGQTHILKQIDFFFLTLHYADFDKHILCNYNWST